MWLRDLKIVKQTKKCDNVFVTLFELITWSGKTRYHTTVHQKPITKKDFEQHYTGRDYNYFPKKKAELLYELMIESETEIKPVIENERAI